MKDETAWRIGLGPGYIVLDGDTAALERGTGPYFRPMSIVAKWLDGARCNLYAGRPRPRPRRHFVR